MGVMLATKTLDKINRMVEEDQGASFRGWLGKVLPHIGDAYRDEKESFRSHMGASLIGQECGRKIWYGHHWTTKPKFSGRILRLFNRGHLEEGRFIALLLMIGAQVYQQDENGKQFRISHANGHFGGSGDGVVVNIPDLAEGQQALCEFKTHGDKSFKELKEKGVREAKFEHYVQMNMYMRKMGIPIALYMAVNKNDDELYGEILYVNTQLSDEFLARAELLIASDKPPKRINESPGFYKCRFCDERPVCHLDAVPDLNCRTCTFSKPADDAQWYCSMRQINISKEIQLTGCDGYAPRNMKE